MINSDAGDTDRRARALRHAGISNERGPSRRHRPSHGPSRALCSIGVFALLLTLGLAACGTPLPRYPAMDDRAALDLIARRADQLRSFRGECDLTMTDARGQSVRLDAVLLAEPPERARLRAWKFGSAVFDVTIDGDRVWIVNDRAPETARVPARTIAESVDFLGSRFFRNARPVPERSGGVVLIVRGRALGRDDVECEIDRPTLTPRRFVAPDGTHELRLDDYDVAAGHPWARTLRFRYESGEIVVRFTSVEMDAVLPAGSFSPPARATPVP